jgi:hypothetical protein
MGKRRKRDGIVHRIERRRLIRKTRRAFVSGEEKCRSVSGVNHTANRRLTQEAVGYSTAHRIGRVGI